MRNIAQEFPSELFLFCQSLDLFSIPLIPVNHFLSDPTKNILIQIDLLWLSFQIHFQIVNGLVDQTKFFINELSDPPKEYEITDAKRNNEKGKEG